MVFVMLCNLKALCHDIKYVIASKLMSQGRSGFMECAPCAVSSHAQINTHKCVFHIYGVGARGARELYMTVATYNVIFAA